MARQTMNAPFEGPTIARPSLRPPTTLHRPMRELTTRRIVASQVTQGFCGQVTFYVIIVVYVLLTVRPVAAASSWATYGWGVNSPYGQVGDGTTTRRDTPVRVVGLGQNAVAVASNDQHTLALKADGTVWAWGYNPKGQLGNGTNITSLTAVQVSGLESVVAISAGEHHSVALKSDGTVWVWGGRSNLGFNGPPWSNSFVPVRVTALAGVKAIAAGYNHTLALQQDGTVWAWGYNNYGQVGDGTINTTTIVTYAPVSTSGLGNVSQIVAGFNHSLALKADGTVWSWGWNANGQLGDGTTITRSSPIKVEGLPHIASVSRGAKSSFALTADGTGWAWGMNYAGELGDGTTYLQSGLNHTRPARITVLSGMQSLIGGNMHTIATKKDGTVWGFGFNQQGQLGIGWTGVEDNYKLSAVRLPNFAGDFSMACGYGHTILVDLNATPPSVDFDADGKADILFRHPSSGEVNLWLVK